MRAFDRTVVAFVFFLMVLGIFHEMKTSKNLELELSDLTSNKIELDSLYKWKSERLKIYTRIVLKQSEVLDRFKSSREAVKKDTILQNNYKKLY